MTEKEKHDDSSFCNMCIKIVSSASVVKADDKSLFLGIAALPRAQQKALKPGIS